MSVCLCVLSNGMFIDPLFSCTSVWAFMTNKIKLLDRFWDKTSQYMPGKSVRFTHRFRGRVFGIEIDHLGKVYWFWDKYSPLLHGDSWWENRWWQTWAKRGRSSEKYVLVSYATFSTHSFHLVHGLLGVTFRDDILHVQHGPAWHWECSWYASF